MKYRNIHTDEVAEWTRETGPEGKPIMCCEDGTRWLLYGTPRDIVLPHGFVPTPPFLNHHVVEQRTNPCPLLFHNGGKR